MDNTTTLLVAKPRAAPLPNPADLFSDRIAGFLCLTRQQQHQQSPSHRVLLSWIPDSLIRHSPDYEQYLAADRDPRPSSPLPLPLHQPPPIAESYAFSVPLDSLSSILVRPPALGWWYGSIVVTDCSGTSHPALFFHDNEPPPANLTINQHHHQHNHHQNYSHDPLDPFTDDGSLRWGGDHLLLWLRKYVSLQRSTTDSRLYLVNPDPSPSPHPPSPSLDSFFNDAKWSILERFSRITQLGARAAHSLLDHPVTKQHVLPRLPEYLVKSTEVRKVADEFDLARVYLAKWAQKIAEEAQASHRDYEGRFRRLEVAQVGVFEVLDIDTLDKVSRRDPISPLEWPSFFDAAGRLSISAEELHEKGIHPDVRNQAWLFLLGVVPWNSSVAERTSIISNKRDEYLRYKARLYEKSENEDERFKIEKDVHRTDRFHPLFAGEDIPVPSSSPFIGTNLHLEMLKDLLLTYNEYNPSLEGYVQGMSDILAPLYIVMQDDSLAFWCFVSFMNRLERNFRHDQTGMKSQLSTLAELVRFVEPKLYTHLESLDSINFFFFYRMFLIWYKREFQLHEIFKLWEVLWSDYLSSQFHIFVAMAILEKHRDTIIDHLRGFDQVLKYMNDLSGCIDLESTLIDAERLFYRFQKSVEEIDRRNKNEPCDVDSEFYISSQLRGLLRRDWWWKDPNASGDI